MATITKLSGNLIFMFYFISCGYYQLMCLDGVDEAVKHNSSAFVKTIKMSDVYIVSTKSQ